MPGARVLAGALALVAAHAWPAPADSSPGTGGPSGLVLASLVPDVDPLLMRDGRPSGALDGIRPALPDLRDAGRAMGGAPLLRGTVAPVDPPDKAAPQEALPPARSGPGALRPKAPSLRKHRLAHAPRPIVPPGAAGLLAPDEAPSDAGAMKRLLEGADRRRPIETGPAAWTLPGLPAGFDVVAPAFSRSDQGPKTLGVGLSYGIARHWSVQTGILAPGLFTGVTGRF